MCSWSAPGPPGCAAAARLARDGAKVALAHRPAVNQRHSESLPGAAARALVGAGLEPVDTLVEGRCGGTLSAWGSGQLVASDGFASPDGAGWWIDRDRFDAALRHRCVGLGVVAPHRPDTRSTPRGPGVDGTIRAGADVSARWVIDATGRTAAVARRLGAIRRTGPPLVAVHARTSTPREQPSARIFLEAEADGWWYVGASSRRRISAVAVIDPVDARRLRWRDAFVTRLGALPNLGRFRRCGHRLDGATGVPGRWRMAGLRARAGLDRLRRRRAGLRPPCRRRVSSAHLPPESRAAKAISSDDTSAAFARIAAQHADTQAVYEARRLVAYGGEHRWAQRPFWARQIGRPSAE